ncbi:hypothetical protein [Mesorhizobium sp.]|uniref:hypothetical protein n=1 Tax=Mesorhizobium sp. TaxID=1871066 RepID=UPI0025BD2EA1|nr:hypothetical protein [Mesorhizobium sp.]
MELAIEEIARAGAMHVEPAFIRGYVDIDEGMFTSANASKLRVRAETAGLGSRPYRLISTCRGRTQSMRYPGASLLLPALAHPS